MPYNSIGDLPDAVKKNLPQHAQKIYLEAFNHAWAQYDRPGERRGNASREATAHRTAWAAVKKKYEKQDDRWVRKND